MTAYLVDTSVWARASNTVVRDRLERLVRGRAALTCRAVDVEILFAARNGNEHRAVREQRQALPSVPIDDAVWERAIDVQGTLADQGRHRGVPMPDLLIAAAAEVQGRPVLHYDAHFDRIAQVTGQHSEWIVPRGSID